MLNMRLALLVILGLMLCFPIVPYTVNAQQAPTYPPVIRAVDFPLVIPYGATVTGKLRYEDPDGDIQSFSCEFVGRHSAGLRCLTIPLFSSYQDETPFLVFTPVEKGSPETPQEVTIRLTLSDQAGNTSYLDLSFTLTSQASLRDTIVQRFVRQTGLTTSPVQQIQVIPFTRETFLQVSALAMSSLENLRVALMALPGKMAYLSESAAPKLSQYEMLSSDPGLLNRFEPTDTLILNRWNLFDLVDVVSPMVVDRYGVIKLEPILEQVVSKEGILKSVVQQGHRPLPKNDPPNSLAFRNWLGFTVVEAELRPQDVTVGSDDGIHIRRHQEDLDVSIADKPYIMARLGFRADGRIEQAGGPLVKMLGEPAEPTECVRARALVAYGFGFPAFKFSVSPLSVDIAGMAWSNGFENLYLTSCANGSIIIE